MRSLLNKYHAAIRHMHGWRVELKCDKCGFFGLPRYEGWMPGMAVNFGDNPTIYAKVGCPKCGKRLTDEAGSTLIELFKDVSLPEENGNIIKSFILGLFVVPSVFAILLFLGVQIGWWRYSAFILLALSAICIQPLVMLMNYRIALLRARCVCGRPEYLFMGLLGRTYCYRCSSCGRLLRLRD